MLDLIWIWWDWRMAILEGSVALCGKMLEATLHHGWPLRKQGWDSRQGNTDQCSNQHLQIAHEKGHLGCINDVTRDIGSRGDAIQKLNRICFKYNKVSNNSKKSREWQGSGIWVWRIEFTEERWWVSQWITWGWSILRLPSFVPVKEKLSLSLLFNSPMWKKQGTSWLRR